MDGSVSVVIPVFNGAGTVADVVEGLCPVLEGRGEPFEIILVNDGSRDASWDVICKLAGRRPQVRGVNLMRNYGQHNALLCGIRAARYDIILTMDDDGQHPPEEARKLLDKLTEGCDVVYGYPEREQHGRWRNLASVATKVVLRRAMGAETARHVSAFRAFRARVRDAFESYRSPYVSIDVLLSWGAARFAAIPVRHAPRRARASNYTLGKLAAHALNMVTGFSAMPLRIASVAGFAFVLFGLGVFAWVIGRYLVEGSSVPGFPFLASIIAVFSGVQLFALGIMGEYLARMHSRSLDRPSYAVRSVIPAGGQPDGNAALPLPPLGQ